MWTLSSSHTNYCADSEAPDFIIILLSCHSEARPYLHCNMCMFHCGGHKLLFRLLQRRGISSFFVLLLHILIIPPESSQSRLNYPQRGDATTTTTLVCMARKTFNYELHCTASPFSWTHYIVCLQGQMTRMQLIWLSTRGAEAEEEGTAKQHNNIVEIYSWKVGAFRNCISGTRTCASRFYSVRAKWMVGGWSWDCMHILK